MPLHLGQHTRSNSPILSRFLRITARLLARLSGTFISWFSSTVLKNRQLIGKEHLNTGENRKKATNQPTTSTPSMSYQQQNEEQNQHHIMALPYPNPSLARIARGERPSSPTSSPSATTSAATAAASPPLARDGSVSGSSSHTTRIKEREQERQNQRISSENPSEKSSTARRVLLTMM